MAEINELENVQNVDEPATEAVEEMDSVVGNEHPVNTKGVLNDDALDQLSAEDEEYAKARNEAKWYVLHTFSGYENVAKENLEIVREKYNLRMRIFDIVIPMEDVVEEKNGKQKVVSRKLMPGYIIVKMIYGDDIWHAVTRTRGITGFVGPKGRPLHLTEEEIHKMRLEKHDTIDTDLKVNDRVEVLEGALNGFMGTIVSMDIPTNRCKVVVEMFGRETPVDLTLTQVRKVN